MASTKAGGYVGILLILLTGLCMADDCSYRDRSGDYIEYICPGLLDDYDETSCCGQSDDQHCCNPDKDSKIAAGVIIGISVTVAVLFFGAVSVIIACVRISTCPLYRGNRTVVTSTVMTNSSVSVPYTATQNRAPPVPYFQNPLAAPIILQNPPVYSQAVNPMFTPLTEVNMSHGNAVGTGAQQLQN